MQTAAPKAKNKWAARLFVAGFLAFLLLPGPLWLLLRGHVDSHNYENRTLAPFPAGVSLTQWPAAFEAWLGDHAPFRNQWMSLNARINWTVGSLDSSDVLLGKEHWLFLKDVSDSKSLSDYQGLTAYTPEEQEQFLQLVGTLQAELEARGSQLAVLFAPAKEGACPQFMPDSIPVVAGPTRVQALAARMQAQQLPVVWPQEALRRAGENQQVYYKYDTHWNNAGAFLASDLVLQQLGRPHAAYDPALIHTDPDTPALKDLANVSAAWALCTDDVYYTVNTPQAALLSRSPEGWVTQYEGQGEGTLLMVRDSFGEMMAPFVAQPFAQALVLHSNALGSGTLYTQQLTLPDAVILEVGERASDGLLRQAEEVLAWVQQLP